MEEEDDIKTVLSVFGVVTKQKVLNLLSDQNLKETVVFLTQKVLILIISPLLILSKKCASRFCRETANENSSLKNEKNLIHT